MSLQYTPLDQIPSIVTNLHQHFHSHSKLDSIDFRLKQLRILYHTIQTNEEQLCAAIKQDLNRPFQDTKFLEFHVFYAEILDVIANLSKWAQPKHVKDVPFIIRFASPKVEKISLGTVLVIAPFNVPMLLALQPLVGAIAGGNTVVLKQSEFVPHTAQLLSEILTQSLDPEVFQVVNGAIPETTILLEQKFDKILYTGSSAVGRIIASNAAKNLTPCILELGGKTPVFIGESVRGYLGIVCKRLLFTKFMNAGQLCVASDYVVVDDGIYDEFVTELLKQAKELYNGVNEANFTHIVHHRAWDRLHEIIETTKGQIIFGGSSSRDSKYIEPTIITNVNFSDSTMKEEIFGPILPIMKINSLPTTIQEIKSHHDTPLAMYVYSHNSAEIQYIKSHIRSGSLLINDGMLHVAIHALPFGGIGESGYGAYHGVHSYDSFTHERAVVEHPFWCDFFWKDKFRNVQSGEWKGSKYLPGLPGEFVGFGKDGEIKGDAGGVGWFKLGVVGAVVAGVGYYYQYYA